MLLNLKLINTQKQIKAKLSVIKKVKCVELLGIKLDNDQKWTSFLGGWWTSSSTKPESICFNINSNHIPKDKLKLLANSIWMSKIGYGLQLTNKVRLTEGNKNLKT